MLGPGKRGDGFAVGFVELCGGAVPARRMPSGEEEEEEVVEG